MQGRVGHQSCAIGTDLGTSNVEAIALDASMHEMSSAAQHIESRHDDAGAKDTSVSPLLTKHFLVNSGMEWVGCPLSGATATHSIIQILLLSFPN